MFDLYHIHHVHKLFSPPNYSLPSYLKRQEKSRTIQPPSTATSTLDPSAEEVSLLDVDSDSLTKSERKARRKEEKRQKKLLEQGVTSSPTQNGTTATTTTAESSSKPFDYTSAPSVLHAVKEDPKAEKKRKRDDTNNKKKQPFDPY
ncbi:MAG: hypothetical protein O7C56_05025, partial [Rickettsia endosymbiont of Ixodes persulcatus]|nr:hypothetical protein [Rickettsia endosymbiont of Ixodes persulcatus]